MAEDRKELVAEADKALSDLIRRTNKENPAPKDLEALQEILKKSPSIAKHYGDLSEIVFTEITGTCYSNQPLFRESVRQHGQNMVKEFDYDSASSVEKLLIQQIVLSWLRYHETEMRWQMMSKDNPTIAQADHWQRRITLAQGRYLRAIETLARVKKLQQKPPSPALNILLRQQLGGK